MGNEKSKSDDGGHCGFFYCEPERVHFQEREASGEPHANKAEYGNIVDLPSVFKVPEAVEKRECKGEDYGIFWAEPFAQFTEY